MKAEEIELLDSHVGPTHRVLEWGSGGSTIWLAKRVGELHSIENDSEWYQAVVKAANNYPRINPWIHFVEGRPSPPVTEYTAEAEDYIQDALSALHHVFHAPFDRVLIDGRARLFCAKFTWHMLLPDSLVFIHDWHRERYHGALDWYELVETAGDCPGLAMLRPNM